MTDSASDPMNEEQAEAAALEHAIRFLTSCYTGILHLDGPDNAVEVAFIRDPETGHVILACPVATFFAEEVVLFTPDEADDAMKLLLSPEQIEESHLTDRLLAYHGEPDQVRYADCYIDSAKHGPWVFDGDAMMISSHLPQQEERTALKALNADKGILRQALLAAHDLDAEDPTAVAIDHLGCDIRARFGVTRIAFDEPITTADEAIEAIKDFAS